MPLPALHQAQELLAQGRPLTEAEVRSLIQQDPELATFLILELWKRNQELESHSSSSVTSSTPSGMIPPFQKPKASRRKKKLGRPPGHPGAQREKPTRIDRKEDHRLECCPDCGGPLQKCHGDRSVRTRILEEIPQTQPEITEPTIHRDYCPHCKKFVEPQVPDALPKASIGHRALTLSACWHYGLGLTGQQILDGLNHYFQFPLSAG
jgi:transposase